MNQYVEASCHGHWSPDEEGVVDAHFPYNSVSLEQFPSLFAHIASISALLPKKGMKDVAYFVRNRSKRKW